MLPCPHLFRGLASKIFSSACVRKVPNLVKIGPKLRSQSGSQTPDTGRTDPDGRTREMCILPQMQQNGFGGRGSGAVSAPQTSRGGTRGDWNEGQLKRKKRVGEMEGEEEVRDGV